MIVFRYSKTDGAEYIPHLDMLRHLNKIMRRAKIPMGYSKGYNPHMHVYMSSPIAVGLKSQSEYCCIESDADASEFLTAFNANSFRGLTCKYAVNVPKKVSVAGLIDRARYVIKGLNKFNVDDILSLDELMVENKKGEVKNVRNKIFDMAFIGDELYATLGFGNDTLRVDFFANELKKRFGGEKLDIIKLECFIGETPFDKYLENLK